ncbi:MAG: hypothetical protein PHV33_13225 [Elusimicrobiales bacterium]|nr:hypothetical protein [Elusimicrobiales bacterium]
MEETELLNKIKILNETIWDRNEAFGSCVELWLSNFKKESYSGKNERLHALFLLSKFLYFGEIQIKEMLKALYRDLYKYPLICKIRRDNGDTLNEDLIKAKFHEELQATRFLGIGNPSESGVFLLYPFRQENNLKRDLFIYSHEIFTEEKVGEKAVLKIKDPAIRHYVFIDDLCSSGTQATSYSKEIVSKLKALSPSVDVQYLVLMGLTEGMSASRVATGFDRIEAVFTLDSSFKCFNTTSRYFAVTDKDINKQFAEEFCQKYGDKLRPGHALGYRNNQLLLGFNHNIPDNTLPIICCGGNANFKWNPVFKRVEKR